MEDKEREKNPDRDIRKPKSNEASITASNSTFRKMLKVDGESGAFGIVRGDEDDEDFYDDSDDGGENAQDEEEGKLGKRKPMTSSQQNRGPV